MEVSIYQARQQLSRLVKRAEAGEEITLTRHSRPVAKLVKALPAKPRQLGLFRGQKVFIDPDWWKPMTDEEVEAFYRGEY
jgi:prevent-host-death family protein